MKTISFYLSCFTVPLIFLGCSGDAPRIRAQNNRPTNATVAVKPVSGSTIHIRDINPGVVTAYIEIPEGSYEVDVNIDSVSGTPTVTLNAEKNGTYTIVIVNNNPATVRIDSP